MGNIVAIVAGCIAYVAWQLTSRENLPDDSDEPVRKDDS